jgi:hypothetical protein
MTRVHLPRLLLIAAPLILLTAGVRTSASTQPTSTTPALSYGNFLPNCYKVNPTAIGYSASNKSIDPLYFLVDWNEVASTQTTYFNQGYVLLGHCDFGDGGIPLREDAIEYGKQLGADLIIYAAQTNSDGRADHYVAFLAKGK